MFASRYGWTVGAIFELDIVILADLLSQINDKNNDEKIFRQWLAILPVMWSGMAKFIEFDEFKDRLTGADIDTRPTAEILADVEEVRRFVG